MAKDNKLSVNGAQNRAIEVFSAKASGDKQAVIQDLYDALLRKRRYAKHLQNSDLTWEDMFKIAENIHKIGVGWDKAFYMPIQPFCRVKSLKYIIAHKKEASGDMGTDVFLHTLAELKTFFPQIL